MQYSTADIGIFLTVRSAKSAIVMARRSDHDRGGATSILFRY